MNFGILSWPGMSRPNAPAMSRRGVFTAGFVALAALTPLAAHAQQATFTVLVENVSTGDALKLPNGTAIRVPIAPGVFAVYRGEAPIFHVGAPAGSSGLETLAEDGNPEPLQMALKGQAGVAASGMFVPGQPFTIAARPGDKLSLAAMFVQSNDLFYGFENGGIDIFNGAGQPVTGDLTARVVLYDAGTEVNEAPGVGPNQAPRQATPNTGPSESKPVQIVNDGFTYPAAAAVIRVTVQLDAE